MPGIRNNSFFKLSPFLSSSANQHFSICPGILGQKHSNFAVTLLYANAQSRRQGGRIKRFLPNLHAPKKSELILPKLANQKYFRRCQLAEQGLVSILTSVDWAGKLPWFLFGDELQTFETTLTPGRCRERLIDCVRFSSFTCC